MVSSRGDQLEDLREAHFREHLRKELCVNTFFLLNQWLFIFVQPTAIVSRTDLPVCVVKPQINIFKTSYAEREVYVCFEGKDLSLFRVIIRHFQRTLLKFAQLVTHTHTHTHTQTSARACLVMFSNNSSLIFYTTNEMQLIQYSLLLSALYMFRAVFPPIIRSL